MFHVPISIGNGAYMHDPAVRTADVPLPFELFDPAHATRVHPCFVAENGDITYAQALEYSLPVPHLGLTYRFRFAKDDGYFDDIWISLSQPLKVKLTYKRGDVPGLVTRVAVQFAQFAMTVLEMGFGNNARTMVASLEPPPASALSLRLSHAGGTVRLWGSGGGLVVVHEVEVPLRSQNAISLEFLAIKLLKAPLDKDPALKQGPWDTPSVRHRNCTSSMFLSLHDLPLTPSHQMQLPTRVLGSASGAICAHIPTSKRCCGACKLTPRERLRTGTSKDR